MSGQTAVIDRKDDVVNVITDVPWRCCWGTCSRMAIATVTFEGQDGHVHHCGAHLLMAWQLCAVSTVDAITKKPCPMPHEVRWADVPRSRA
jgi:hypothetical protein